jgi:hypothetical protein
MSNQKKGVKRRPRVLEARDLMSVTGGGVGQTGGSADLPTIGMFPQGPRGPRNPWEPHGPTIGGPTIGFAPTGPGPIVK